MHGPYLGPDGFFYWCKGAFAPQTHLLGNGKTFKSSAAHIYRARPDGSQLEVVITGGMNNPVGLAFSEVGERFLSGTFFDLSKPGRRDGILHAVYGGTYGRRNDRVLSPHPSTGTLLSVLSQMGPSASSGIVMPRSDALDMRGDLLCADFNLRRISRHRLSRAGSTYSAQMSTLLESDQNDFHPTDVIEDADGSLLVADTGSWYMICCPTSKVAKPDVLGAIYRIERKNNSSPKDPRGLELDWNNPQVDWLSDKRPALVKRAIESLAQVGSVDRLKEAKARKLALWSLNRIPGKPARSAIRSFLKHADPSIRKTAAHILNSGPRKGRREQIEAYRSALKIPADEKRGRAVFDKLSAVCHLPPKGQPMNGPDLRSITDRTKTGLFSSILDPNQTVDASYAGYSVTLADGSALYGRVLSETSNNLILRLLDGSDRELLRREIKILRNSGLSLMPEGLEAGMNHQELADLIRFVQTFERADK
jgi:putative heme-binding domain-containing protein